MLDDDLRLVPLSPAARRLRVPSRWLKAEAEAGKVPCLNAGGRLLFDLQVVARVLAERAQASPATEGGKND